MLMRVIRAAGRAASALGRLSKAAPEAAALRKDRRFMVKLLMQKLPASAGLGWMLKTSLFLEEARQHVAQVGTPDEPIMETALGKLPVVADHLAVEVFVQ